MSAEICWSMLGFLAARSDFSWFHGIFQDPDLIKIEKMTAQLTLEATSTPTVPRSQSSMVSRNLMQRVAEMSQSQDCNETRSSRGLTPGARMRNQQMDIPEGSYVGQGRHRNKATMGMYGQASVFWDEKFVSNKDKVIKEDSVDSRFSDRIPDFFPYDRVISIFPI